MTLALQQYAVEPIMIVEIDWGNQGSWTAYGDKYLKPVIDSGVILSAATVSKRGTVENSDVSQTCSIILDDYDGALKDIYDTLVITGSKAKVYHYFTGSQSPAIKHLLFEGVITSDVIWSEGERTLEFQIEDGGNRGSANSSEIGYAPEEGAFADLNSNAVGKNWPLVFGTVAKVPAVRIKYQEDMETEQAFTVASTTVDITNGEQLPQGTPIQLSFSGVLCTGSMSGKTFTFSSVNDEKYSEIDFAERPESDDDVDNPSVAWVTPGTNIYKQFILVEIQSVWTVNFCEQQIGEKCYFTQAFPNDFAPDEDSTIESVAKWPRTDWAATYVSYTDGGNLMTLLAKDGWTVKRGTPVTYTDVTDTYVCNLIPSTSIIEVWGKRTFYGKEIFAKIPSSYYTKTLDYTIITDPGAVERHITILEFDKPLSQYDCEGWKDEVYVTLESSISGSFAAIVNYVISNYTTYTYSVGDTVSIPANFAYMQTTDALEFLKELAWQVGAALIIRNSIVMIRNLAITPSLPAISSRVHTLGYSQIILKSLILGTKTTEDMNTNIEATYVTDYSGEKDSSKIYIAKKNQSAYGVQSKSYDFWGLTCGNAVEDVADFWSNRQGQSWKTARCKLFINSSDIEVFDLAKFQIDPFLPTNTYGVILSVTHDLDSPNVEIEVELGIPVGSMTADPNYWIIAVPTCALPTGSEEDYTPDLDDSCPVFSSNLQTTSRPYHVAGYDYPSIVFRWSVLQFVFKIHDAQHNLRTDSTWVYMKMYTNSPTDSFFEDDVYFEAGVATVTITIRGSLFPGVMRVYVVPYDKTIISGEVIDERKAHL